MKATFKFGIKAYSGTLDGVTFANFEKHNVVIAREYVCPEKTEHNVTFGSRGSIISRIYRGLAPAFLKDIELYTNRYYAKPEFDNQIPGNKYTTVVKMLYAVDKDSTNGVTLDHITIDDFGQEDYPITTVQNLIDDGYLESVPKYDDLIANAI